ncbi:MAG: DUF362 domain-containing protein [Armatimonadota bacterium]|nr:DUF362 domain-containing protein [Armatimonadota bacterium]
MSLVHFASSKVKSLNADLSLPAKFRRLLNEYPLKEMFDKKSIAIKMHVGGHLGYTTIHPLFVRILIDALREAGGRPFITDGSGAIPGAKIRGYTEEVLGAPIVPAAGLNDNYYKVLPVGYHTLKDIQTCGEIVSADAMIVFSHGKGHGHCGYGGAIKNIAMGCVTGHSRGSLHQLIDTEFEWDEDHCAHCYLCRANCPGGAITFNKEGRFNIFFHDCRYCMHCVTSCPENAIKINTEGIRWFQVGMAKATETILNTFEPSRLLYITALMNITPLCDCWGYSTPAIVPDIGIMASTDMVALEQASLDSIKVENFLPGSLPEPLALREEGTHLLEKIHGKDPYLQIETAAEIGLGSREYTIKEVD